MSDAPNRQAHQIRWAVITKIGSVVVEAETADAASEKVGRRDISSSKSMVTAVAKRCRSRLRAGTQSATSLRPQRSLAMAKGAVSKTCRRSRLYPGPHDRADQKSKDEEHPSLRILFR